MRLEQFEVTCDRCGGPGVGSIRTAAEAWRIGSDLYHANPMVCDYYQAEAKRAREREILSQKD